MSHKAFRSIDLAAQSARIQQCEQRLALSASLAGDLLLDILDIHPSADQPADADVEDTSPDLISQAAQLRAESGLDGSGQTVAVIDSGIAWDHISLGGGYGPGYRVVGGWDFAEHDADPYDDGPAGFHGSHVAGLLAGQSDDFAGIAPGADLVGLRVFDDTGAGRLEWIESALQWVHDNRDAFESPITTVNLSVGAVLTTDNMADAESMLADELQQLRDDNILVFAAAGNLYGNADSSGVMFPASDPSVVAVSSVAENGELSEFAQREPDVLATRGEDISSAVPEHVYGWDGDYDDTASLDGTSMATPQVAGASMLIRQSLIQQGIEPTADAILSRLHDTAMTNTDAISGDDYDTVDLIRAVSLDQPEGLSIDQVASRFDGTNDGEQVQLDLRDGVKLRVGDLTYQLTQPASGEPMTIDVGGGADAIEIIGSVNSERLTFDPRGLTDSVLMTNEFTIQLRGFEEVAFVGGGGSDQATLYDTSGNDILESRPGSATLSGVGFQIQVSNVPRVYVHATAGGNDTAYLNDSAGVDSLAVRPQFTSLRNDDTFQLALGFERVYAYATAGGNDSAEIYDSAGDDIMSVTAGSSMISSSGYQVSAMGFASIVGYATAGGHDIANLYADEIARWHSTDDMVQWTGEDANRVARGFERVQAFEQYELVDLHQRATEQALWAVDDDDRNDLEAEAIRAVFDALGSD